MAANTGDPQPERAGADLKTHPLVEKLLQSGGEPRALVSLIGYVGPSKKEGHVRLYSGLDFQSYYEIPREHVVLAEAIDADDDNSPTQLLLKAEATVDLVQTSTQTGPASYLAGSIAGAYLPLAGVGQFPLTQTIVQHHTIWHCAITFATQCVCTIPIVCRGNPGGVVGEEALLALPPGVSPAPMPGGRAPVLGPPPDAVAAAANMNQTVFCGTQRCGPPATLHCRWDVAPQAAAFVHGTASYQCQTALYQCWTGGPHRPC